MTAWVERIRQESHANVEYAVAAQLQIVGKPAALVRYGAGGYVDGYAADLPVGEHEFPIMSIGAVDEFGQHLKRFDEDIWNLAGCDFQQQPFTFQIADIARW
jgi:hypothetical protein